MCKSTTDTTWETAIAGEVIYKKEKIAQLPTDKATNLKAHEVEVETHCS